MRRYARRQEESGGMYKAAFRWVLETMREAKRGRDMRRELYREAFGTLIGETPRGPDVQAVGRRMVSVEGVEEVYGLHLRTIDGGFPALAAHVQVGKEEKCEAKRYELEEMLLGEFGIDNTILQVDHAGVYKHREET